MSRLWLIRSFRPASKDRHHNKPAVCELIVPHHRIAVISRLTCAAEPFEKRVRWSGAIQHLAGRFVTFALLGKDSHPRVDDLEYVIFPDRNAVVRWIAQVGSSLRTFEPYAEPIKAFDQRGARLSSLTSLFDRSCPCRNCNCWRRNRHRCALSFF